MRVFWLVCYRLRAFPFSPFSPVIEKNCACYSFAVIECVFFGSSAIDCAAFPFSSFSPGIKGKIALAILVLL